MKKYIKITIILLLIGLGLMQCSKVYADYVPMIKGSTEWYDPSSSLNNQLEKNGELSAKIRNILAVIRNIGIVLSVLILMILGIKEMIAGVEEKSTIKKALPGYILGVFLVTAITVLPSIIYELVNNF